MNLLGSGLQDINKNENGSLKSPAELDAIITNHYNNQASQHFSTVLLKDKTGEKIQSSLEKTFIDPVRVAGGKTDADAFEPAGIHSGDTPHYSTPKE